LVWIKIETGSSLTIESPLEIGSIARTDAYTLLVEQEAALRAMRQNLAAIYEASGDGLALCEAIFDGQGHVVDYQALEVNRAHAELTAASREVMLTKRVSTIEPPLDPRWLETAQTVLTTGVMQDFDIRSRATGRWLNIRISRVSDTLFQQTFVDVSDRHRLHEQHKMLLKEMSHRVMNNFHMVASFLNLQSRTADAAAKAQLRTAERRVHVLAKLHSLLALTESDREIDAGAYVQELCEHLRSSFERCEAITLSCRADAMPLPTEIVVPLGFIISELVTNSAKYAYPAPAIGVITVRLCATAGGWDLVIEDNGPGYHPGTPEKGTRLGMRLVGMFVEQIGAVMTTRSTSGVRHEIRYARDNATASVSGRGDGPPDRVTPDSPN
jgi:two-component sensor histidine kinase